MITSQMIIVLVIVVAAGLIIYFVSKIRAQAGALDDGAPMPAAARRILVGYFLVLGLFLAYMLVSLNSIAFPDSAAIPQEVVIPTPPSPTPPPTNQPTNGKTTVSTPSSTNEVAQATLYRVFPQTSTNSPVTVRLTVYGDNFKKNRKFDLIPNRLIQVLFQKIYSRLRWNPNTWLASER